MPSVLPQNHVNTAKNNILTIIWFPTDSVFPRALCYFCNLGTAVVDKHKTTPSKITVLEKQEEEQEGKGTRSKLSCLLASINLTILVLESNHTLGAAGRTLRTNCVVGSTIL